MTILRKTASAALVVAILAGSGLSAASANAAPLIRATPAVSEAQTADVVQAGYHGHNNKRHGWNRHGWRHYGGYYGRHCFYVKKRFWDSYYGGYFFKKVRVCR